MTSEPSLADLNGLFGHLCDGAVSAFHYAKDHQARTEALEKVLEFAYDNLVENRHLNQNQGEDELSVQVVGNLRMLSIQADHDTQIGGHCDILVRGTDHYLWIGEAKIHKNYGWLVDGFQQLSTRYAVGGYGKDRGEIIIYCRTSKAADTLRNWKSKMTEEFPDVIVTEDRINERLWFRTKHNCINSGTPFYTRHRILALYWAPQK